MPFKKGKDWKGNPKGRPKSPEIEELRQAIEKARKAKDKSILEHFVERAYKNDQVLVALIKKLIADKHHTELGGELAVALEPLIIRIDEGKKKSPKK